jgi:hypothetical protein
MTQGLWWVVIEHEDTDRDTYVGPFHDAERAGRSMEDSSYIQGLCEEDCIECFTTCEQPDLDVHEVLIINPFDPHFTGDPDEDDDAGVSPANAPTEKESRRMDTVIHTPNEHFAAAQRLMTCEDRLVRRGFTLMPDSGWLVYQGPRLVKLTWWDQHGQHHEDQDVEFEHAWIMRLLQDHLDEIGAAQGNPVDSAQYDVVEAALNLVLSDAQTGTSLAAWPVMNRLVDRALTGAMYRAGWRVTTQWEEF